MLRQAPRSTRPSTLFPYTKLVRSGRADGCGPTDGPSSRLPPTVARQRSPTTRRPTSRQITVEMVRTTLEHAGNGGRDANRTSFSPACPTPRITFTPHAWARALPALQRQGATNRPTHTERHNPSTRKNNAEGKK